MHTALMFSSRTDEWETPAQLFEGLNEEFCFSLDVCASCCNKKCESFYSRKEDALKQEWSGICWMNPPYGREIWRWVQKAYESSRNGATVVCLLPARTDTSWWQDYVIPHADEVRFIRGRLKFSGSRHNAPFPSAIVIFKGW
ncbi:phage N-6-adenine-methyltransferase [Synergistaceae bacterium OttesenSCG-928-I11]|nr:phage N-6-adenine-methyltransferase [Synergistaceae bacterium OttesenSCG-928-I11]